VDKLGNLLPAVIARQPGGGRVAELRIRLALAEVVGPRLSAACHSVELQRGTLTVATADRALAEQLRSDGAELLARINARHPGRRLRRLHVRFGHEAALRP
jgi:hypothetical protein